MKTIKRERQVRLDELLRLVWDGEVLEERFYDQENNVLFIDKKDGEIKQADHTCKSDLFTITEEVEITEDTPLNLVVVDDENEVTNENKTKISTLKKEAETFGYEFKFIYLQNEDGSIGELIWKDGGLVD